MNKKNLVIYTKTKEGWNMYIGGTIHQSVFGLSTKNHAVHVLDVIKRVYNKGRYDEFTENNNKTDSLMKRFGI